MTQIHEFSGLPENIQDILQQGQNEQWPSPAMVGYARALFDPTLSEMYSVSTEVLTPVLQHEALSSALAAASHLGSPMPPAEQLQAAAKLRTETRKQVLPQTIGLHVFGPNTLNNLPGPLRATTASYLLGLTATGRHQVWLASEAALAEMGFEGQMATVLGGGHGPRHEMSALTTNPTIKTVGNNQLVAPKPETGTEVFYPQGTAEAWEVYRRIQKLLGRTASSEQTVAYLNSVVEPR